MNYTHPPAGPSTPPPKPGPVTNPKPKFRVPAPPTLLNSLIDCGRAWGKALVGVARLLTGRPV